MNRFQDQHGRGEVQREAQNKGKLTVLSISAWAALERRGNMVETLKTTKLHGDYRKKTKHMASVITSLMKMDSTGQQKNKQKAPRSLTHAMDRELMLENSVALQALSPARGAAVSPHC